MLHRDVFDFFFLSTPRPPRHTRTDPRFPSTPLVRSHARAFAGDHARRQAVAARSIAAGKAVAGGERKAGAGVGGGAAFAVGHTVDGARRIFEIGRAHV